MEAKIEYEINVKVRQDDGGDGIAGEHIASEKIISHKEKNSVEEIKNFKELMNDEKLKENFKKELLEDFLKRIEIPLDSDYESEVNFGITFIKKGSDE